MNAGQLYSLKDPFKLLQYPAHGQAHDIIKVARNGFYAGHAYPFLYGISAGLIIGLVLVYIIADLFLSKLMKLNGGTVGKCNLAAFVPDHYPRYNAMACS